MRVTTIAAVGAGALGLEVARRYFKKSKITTVPAQVSARAATALQGMRISPCGTARGTPRDYTELYILQKRALIAQFGSAQEYYCSPKSGSCLPIPLATIPTATRDCTRAVVGEWLKTSATLLNSGDAHNELAGLLFRFTAELSAMMNSVPGVPLIGFGDGKLSTEANRRVWSHIGQISLCLQGVLIHHGNAEAEARAELVKTLTDPKEYAAAGGDLLGSLLGVVGDIAGPAAAKFLASNAGAIAIVGGGAYLVLRRSS